MHRTLQSQPALSWLSALDLQLCRRLNRAARPGLIRALILASRLGDGILWYVLMGALPVVLGREGLQLSLRMAGVGLVCLGLYRLIKERAARPRPFQAQPGIRAWTAPLDRYAFPSGHTMHAVAFTWILVAEIPELAIWLVPFAAVVAASRVVLGLHYPSDVLAGGALGATIAGLSRLI
jgi:undecaprenyl-diphosphatase